MLQWGAAWGMELHRLVLDSLDRGLRTVMMVQTGWCAQVAAHRLLHTVCCTPFAARLSFLPTGEARLVVLIGGAAFGCAALVLHAACCELFGCVGLVVGNWEEALGLGGGKLDSMR